MLDATGHEYHEMKSHSYECKLGSMVQDKTSGAALLWSTVSHKFLKINGGLNAPVNQTEAGHCSQDEQIFKWLVIEIAD